MKSLLFISNNQSKAAELQQALADLWSVEHRTPEQGTKLDGCFGVILDCDPDSGVNTERRKKFALDCRRAEVPLYLGSSHLEAVSSIVNSSKLVSGVISHPFKKQEVVKLLRSRSGHRLEPDNDDILRYFVKATMEVLRTLAGENSSCLGIKSEGEFEQFGSICGLMELTGALQTSVAVSLEPDFAAVLARQIIGDDCGELSDSDLGGVAGELINQITSVVRNKLWRDDYQFEIDLPTVYVNREEPAAVANDKKWQSAVIQAENHSLMIQMSIKISDSAIVYESPPIKAEPANQL